MTNGRATVMTTVAAALVCALPMTARADDVEVVAPPPASTTTTTTTTQTTLPISACAGCLAEHDVHVGLNFRTDFGTHYYRADVGVRRKRWDFTLVLDPLGIPKGDYDFDATVRHVGDQWSWWTGARLSMVPIARGTQYTEKALIGISAQLPKVLSDRVRIHSGLELAVHLHAHGAGIMTRWVCVDSPDCREDHFVFSLFGRIEYASPF